MNTIELKELQLTLETERNNNKVIPLLTKMLKEDNSVKAFLSEHVELEPKIFIRTLVNLAIHKRIDVPTFVGLLYNSFKGDIEGILNYLLHLEELEFLVQDENKRYYSPSLVFPEELENNLIKWQYPLPLVTPPKKLTSNNSSGYFSIPFEKVILKHNINQDIYLEHLNRLNSVPYRINVAVYNDVNNKWEGKKKKKKDPFQIYVAEFTTKKNFDRYMKFAYEHIELLYDLNVDFYFSWRYCYRGRSYSQGYYLNCQGNDWNKYTIQLAKAEVVKTK